jgi:death-on-curing protein
MKYLAIQQVLRIHARTIAQFGGDASIRDLGLLESAVAQPRARYGDVELYPTLVDKAVALAFSLSEKCPETRQHATEPDTQSLRWICVSHECRMTIAKRRLMMPGVRSMSTIISTPPLASASPRLRSDEQASTSTGEQRITIRGIPWDLYDRLLSSISEDQHVRLSYDGKDLEIMTTGYRHEGLI